VVLIPRVLNSPLLILRVLILQFSVQFRTPPSTLAILDGFNLFYTIVFTIEMVLKLIGLGWKSYLSDNFNKLDFVIVISSLAELGMGGGGATSAFRALRVLRIMKMLKHVRSMRALVLGIGNFLEISQKFLPFFAGIPNYRFFLISF
jgi:hypothetical protein